jgi:hypothetical protein
MTGNLRITADIAGEPDRQRRPDRVSQAAFRQGYAWSGTGADGRAPARRRRRCAFGRRECLGRQPGAVRQLGAGLQGATEQAASAEEASASMEEMASNIKQNADNAAQTEKIARQSAKDAEASGDAVTPRRRSHAHHRREDRHRPGNRPPDRPARAQRRCRGRACRRAWQGLCGRRFRSAQACRTQPVGRSRDRRDVGDTVKAAQEAGDMLGRLVPDIRKTAELVSEISAACREQDIGASQINEAIQQLDKVTQQNAGASEQMSATSEELAARPKNCRPRSPSSRSRWPGPRSTKPAARVSDRSPGRPVGRAARPFRQVRGQLGLGTAGARQGLRTRHGHGRPR